MNVLLGRSIGGKSKAKLTSLEAGTEGVNSRDMEELLDVVFVVVIWLLDDGLSFTPFIIQLHNNRIIEFSTFHKKF